MVAHKYRCSHKKWMGSSVYTCESIQKKCSCYFQTGERIKREGCVKSATYNPQGRIKARRNYLKTSTTSAQQGKCPSPQSKLSHNPMPCLARSGRGSRWDLDTKMKLDHLSSWILPKSEMLGNCACFHSVFLALHTVCYSRCVWEALLC